MPSSPTSITNEQHAVFGRTVYSDCPHCGYKDALATTRVKGRPTLFFCHAGCSQEEVLRCIDDSAPRESASIAARRRAGTEEYARLLWSKSLPATVSLVERYLRKREITSRIPAVLRYLPDHLHVPTGTHWPVMLASVVDATGNIRAVHRTYLDRDGTAKAPIVPARMSLGGLAGHACRLSDATEKLAVAEGVETAMSFQAMTGIPSWAALSAGGIRTLELPPLPVARYVTIAADADKPGVQAAELAAERWRSEGRMARIILPPRPGLDFNDVLIGAKL